MNTYGEYCSIWACHAKMCLQANADWDGRRPSLSAKRIIGYFKMEEWRAEAQMILSACAG